MRRIWPLVWLLANFALAAGLAIDARAGDDEPVPSQVAKAGPGGVALNIYGDRNVVNISATDPQVKSIVNGLMKISMRVQKRQRDQDDNLAEVSRQMEEVRLTVASLVASARQPNADQASQKAVNLLAAGDTEAARDILKNEEHAVIRVAEQQGADGAAKMQRAAMLAIDQGTLASLTDTQAAIAAFERASRYEPENPWTLLKLGDLQLNGGRTADALATFEKAKMLVERHRSVGERPGSFEHEMAAVLFRIGDAMAALGNNDGALEQYRDGLSVSARYADATPDMSGLLRARAVLYQRVGDVLVLKRDYLGASSQYDQSVAVRKRLLEYRPKDSTIALGLSSTYQKIGDMRNRQSDYDGAMAAYGNAQSVALTPPDPGSPDFLVWRSNQAKLYQRIGSTQLEQKKGLEAKKSLSKALESWMSLVERDPKNFDWQQNLTFTYMRLGDVDFRSRNYHQAVVFYRQALFISEALARQDSSNLYLKRRQGQCERKVGQAQNLDGDGAGALLSLKRAVKIGEELNRRDPANAQWRTDLAMAYWRLGTVKEGQTLEDRTTTLRKSERIFKELSEKGELERSDERFYGAVSRELAQLSR